MNDVAQSDMLLAADASSHCKEPTAALLDWFERHARILPWRVGPKDQPYGRFARGFNEAKGKAALCFDIDDAFFEKARSTVSMTSRFASHTMMAGAVLGR